MLANDAERAKKLNQLRGHAEKVRWHVADTEESLRGLERGEAELALNVPQHIEGRMIERMFNIKIPEKLVGFASALNATAEALEAGKIPFLAREMGLPETSTRRDLIMAAKRLHKAEVDRLAQAERQYYKQNLGAYRMLLTRKRALEKSYYTFLVGRIKSLTGI